MYKKSIIVVALIFAMVMTMGSAASTVLPAIDSSAAASAALPATGLLSAVPTELAAASANGQPDAVIAASTQSAVIRMGGKDRFATAAEIAFQGWPTHDVNVNSNVVVVRGSGEKMFADAMSATALAYMNNAPILLVDDNKIPEDTFYMFNNLRLNNVFIVGGPGVVTDNIKDTLKPHCRSIERIYGNDRYETAVEVGDRIKETFDFDTVFIATGKDFPDALTAAPYSAVNHMPIVFVSGNKINSVTKDALKRWGIKKAYIVGETGVVPETIAEEARQMGIQTERLGGKDRYETALIIAKRFNTSSDGVAIATGKDYPDALAGAAYAAKKNVPILLVNYNKMADSVREYISEKKFAETYIFGGPGAVADELIEFIKQLTGQGGGVQDPVDPKDAVMGNTSRNIVNFGIATSDDDWIYYSDFYNDTGTGIYKIKKDGTSRTKLSDDWGRYLNVVDGWLYYMPMHGKDAGKIIKIKTDGLQRTVLGQDPDHALNAGSLMVIDDTIYFINYNDRGSLYKADTNGKNLTKLTIAEAHNFYIVDNYIYYSEIVSNASYSIMHRMRKDGLYDTVFPAPYDKRISLSKMDMDNDWIYYTVFNDGLYKIKTDFTQNTKLLDNDYTIIIGIKDGWIYYWQFSKDKDTISRIKTDGSDNTVLLKDAESGQYNLVDNWIIYQIVDGPNSGKVYRLSLSGGQLEQIQ